MQKNDIFQIFNFQSSLSLLPVIASAALLIAVCGLFSGCYSLTQGMTLLGYLNRAVPLEQTEDEDFVRLITDIRAFAIEELGLADSKNYTRYVQLDRNYLAAVVSASAKDSFRRHEWDYPVVGRLPYKGFFNVDGARRERANLEKKDLDVWVRGVDAFSTLGWFTDPLYSYMRDYSPARLADLLIHELVHATVFIKGQAQFNEELAEFIGSEGGRLYMEMRYGLDSEEYRQMLASNTDSQSYVSFVQELIAELNVLYSSGNSREEILAEKERIINAAKERFDAEYESRFSSDNFRGFSELPINNAYLELFRLYHAEDNFYSDLYERTGRNLPAFITAAKTITKNGSPRVQLENALLGG
ncbi:MAG: aminopeptidase [Treponema sp.]|jgi:predicted aminopeptidase|nr:aminopeptidase [Treponema sp.]